MNSAMQTPLNADQFPFASRASQMNDEVVTLVIFSGVHF
jgi:hypothetical protein